MSSKLDDKMKNLNRESETIQEANENSRTEKE